MKWRVMPDLTIEGPLQGPAVGATIAFRTIDTRPDIVEADEFNVDHGCLVFWSHIIRLIANKRRDGPSVIKAYAPGQWTTVERVEGDDA